MSYVHAALNYKTKREPVLRHMRVLSVLLLIYALLLFPKSYEEDKEINIFMPPNNCSLPFLVHKIKVLEEPRTSVVHFNFRAGSTFPVPVCTVSPGLWVDKALAGATRLTWSDFRLNLLLLMGQGCVRGATRSQSHLNFYTCLYIRVSYCNFQGKVKKSIGTISIIYKVKFSMMMK